MRKYFVATVLACTLATAGSTVVAQTAQEPVKQYLPQRGDFAFGVDVIPLFKTIGGSYLSSETVPVGGTAPDYDMYLRPNVSIMGKYMFSDKWAIKANLGIAVRNSNNRLYTVDDLAAYDAPTSEAKVIDSRKVTRSGGSLMLGIESRGGKRRVQGVFGGGVLFGFSTYKESYTYGNALTSLNRYPSTAFPDVASSVALPAGYRVTDYNFNGPSFVAGIYGSVGAEWFVAPKIALGATVDLYLYGSFGAKGWVKSEGYNEAYRLVEKRTDLYTPGNVSVNFGTDNLGGSLYLMFYF